VLSKEIWYHIGAESNASYIAARYGIPMAHGGFLARLRAVARYGLLFTPSYTVVSDHQIISDDHIEFLWSGGRPELRPNAGIKHNIYQWDEIYANGDYFKGGWAGQGLLVNPDRDWVAVWSGYYSEDGTSVAVLPMIRTILQSVYGSGAPAGLDG